MKSTPPLDIAEFSGAITLLASTPEFEERLAAAMIRTYKSRRSPDLAPEVLIAMDKSYSYQYAALGSFRGDQIGRARPDFYKQNVRLITGRFHLARPDARSQVIITGAASTAF